MKTVLKILIALGILPNKIKTFYKAMNVIIPRKISFSGNFSLNTLNIALRHLWVDCPN